MRRGFTLIELLVVISIIGLLSSIVLASLNTAKSKGLDVARIQDVKSIKLAIEMYANDNNAYPVYGTCGSGYNISNLAALLVPKYISTIPQQLINDGDAYVWGPGSSLSCTGATTAGQYGIRVVLTNMSTCKTGVNIRIGWWGIVTPECSF